MSIRWSCCLFTLEFSTDLEEHLIFSIFMECKMDINIEHGRKIDIVMHMQSSKHSKNVKSNEKPQKDNSFSVENLGVIHTEC